MHANVDESYVSLRDLEHRIPSLNEQSSFSIMKAGEEGYVNTYIICPGTVCGAGWGPVGKLSIYIKYLGGLNLQQKSENKVGEGTSVFGFVRYQLLSKKLLLNLRGYSNQVHIKDLTDCYVKLFGQVLKLDGKLAESSPYSHYHVISKESLGFGTVQEAFAKEFYRRGLLSSDDVKTVAYEDFGMFAKCVGRKVSFEIRNG